MYSEKTICLFSTNKHYYAIHFNPMQVLIIIRFNISETDEHILAVNGLRELNRDIDILKNVSEYQFRKITIYHINKSIAYIISFNECYYSVVLNCFARNNSYRWSQVYSIVGRVSLSSIRRRRRSLVGALSHQYPEGTLALLRECLCSLRLGI